jgi:hypothetical protein
MRLALSVVALAAASVHAQGRLDPEISRLVAKVSEQRVTKTVSTLVGFKTRHACGQQIAQARDFVRDQLAAVPGMKVTLDPFEQPRCVPPSPGNNVVGYLPGADPKRIILIGGHYDSLAFTGAPERRETERFAAEDRPAPGANDSGSQTAVVLETARVMAGHAFGATVAFVAFAGEEQGLVGSKALAQHTGTLFPGARIEAVLNCDIVGGDKSVNDEVTLHQFRLYSPGAPREAGHAPDGVPDNTSPSRGVMRFVGFWGGRYVPSMTAIPRLREDRLSRGGDHESFIAQGVPAVRFIEAQENVAHQHTPEDTQANMTPAYAARIAQVVAASAAALARAPVAPSSFVAAIPTPGHFHATWSPVEAAASYVVAIRPIGEDYYRIRMPVPAKETAFDGALKDFGIVPEEPFFASVAAIDSAGHESLFAYPEIRCEKGTCAAPTGAADPKAVVP